MGKQCLTFTAHRGRPVRQAATRSNPIMIRGSAATTNQTICCPERERGEERASQPIRFAAFSSACAQAGPRASIDRYLLIWYKFIRIDRDLSLRALDPIFEFKDLPHVSSRRQQCTSTASVVPTYGRRRLHSSGMDCTWCPKKKLSAAPNTQTCCRSFLSCIFSFLFLEQELNNNHLLLVTGWLVLI